MKRYIKFKKIKKLRKFRDNGLLITDYHEFVEYLKRTNMFENIDVRNGWSASVVLNFNNKTYIKNYVHLSKCFRHIILDIYKDLMESICKK